MRKNLDKLWGHPSKSSQSQMKKKKPSGTKVSTTIYKIVEGLNIYQQQRFTYFVNLQEELVDTITNRSN